MRRMSGNSKCALVAVVVSAAMAAAAAGQVVPAPSVGGPRPTVALGGNVVALGETVTVSGAAPPGFSEVRITLLIDQDGDGIRETMQSLGTLPVVGGAYAGDVLIDTPALGTPDILGSAQIAVAVEGAVDAEFEVADVLVNPPAPGVIEGTVPVEALTAEPAYAELIDPLTTTVLSRVPVQADGSFSFGAVAIGQYDIAITGALATAVGGATGVSNFPDVVAQTNLTALACGTGFSDFAIPGNESDNVSYVSATPNFAPSVVLGSAWTAQLGVQSPVSTPPAFGQYIAHTTGDPFVVTFTAGVQRAGDPPAGVRFRIVGPAGNVKWEQDVLTPNPDGSYSVECAAIGSDLEPRTYELEVYTLSNIAGDDGDLIGCFGKSVEILVIDNPAEAAMFNGTVAWSQSKQKYVFEGYAPDFGVLEYWFPSKNFEIPYIGPAASGYQAGVYIKGTVDLLGRVEVTKWRIEAEVDILGKNFWSDSLNLTPADDEQPASTSGLTFTPQFLYGDVGDIVDPAAFEVVSNTFELFSKYKKWEVFDGYLVTFWGIVSVGASIDIAIDVALDALVAQRPMLPDMTATLLPSAQPALTLSIYAEILLGLASGGADATASGYVQWPIDVEIDANNDVDVNPQTPCLGFDVLLEAWAKVLGQRFDIAEWELFCEDSPNNCFCGAKSFGRDGGIAMTLPAEMAAPSVAAGPNGERMVVYAEGGGAAGKNQLRIVARHWNAATQTWGPATAISPLDHAAIDPVVAYYGPNGNAAVAYTLNNIDESGGVPTETVAQVLMAQEIVVVTWNAATGTWSAPFALTADALSDGRAAIAGSLTGFTVAWTRDAGDGDPVTKNDWQIAVRHFQPGIGWSTTTLLDTAPQFAALGMPGLNPMDVQVDVDRVDDDVVLAWVADHDADPATNGNRRVAVARSVAAPGQPQFFNWNVQLLDKGHEPAGWSTYGATQPTVAYSPVDDVVHVVYLARGKDDGGITDAGIGNNNELWHARFGPVVRTADPILADGELIMAEKPELDRNVDGRLLLLTRVFGSLERGLNYFRGQSVLVTFDPVFEEWSSLAWVTDGADQQWQQELAIDEVDGSVLLVSVSRALDGAVSLGQPGGDYPCVDVVTLTNSRDPVEVRTLASGADLGVRVQVADEDLHAPTGSQITAEIVFYNWLALAASVSQRVQVFAGPDTSGPLLFQTLRSQPLNPLERISFPVMIERTSGYQYITVRISEGDPQGPDLCNENNTFTLALGRLLPPRTVSASISSAAPNSALVTCDPPGQADIGGFRWLRGTSPNGPFTNVGETAAPVFMDRELPGGGTYYYAVQMYDAEGVFSDVSAAAVLVAPSVEDRNWSGSSGTWSDPSAWGGIVPGDGDDVTIASPGGYTVSVAADVSTGSVTLGRQIGQNTQTLELAGHQLTLRKPLTVRSTGMLNLSGGVVDVGRAWVQNLGDIAAVGPNNQLVGDFNNDGTLWVISAISSTAPTLAMDSVQSAGEIVCDFAGAGATTDLVFEELKVLAGGKLQLNAGGGAMHRLSGDLVSYGEIRALHSAEFTGAGRQTLENFGSFNIAAPVTLTYGAVEPVINWGLIDIESGGALLANGPARLVNFGEMRCTGGSLIDASGATIVQRAGGIVLAQNATVRADVVDVRRGYLHGWGTVAGLLQSGGETRVGRPATGAPAVLTVRGEMVCQPEHVLALDLFGGGVPGVDYDQLVVMPDPALRGTGQVTLAGSLKVTFADGFAARPGAVFELITAENIAGTFGAVSFAGLPDGLVAEVTYGADRVTLALRLAEPEPGNGAPGKLRRRNAQGSPLPRP